MQADDVRMSNHLHDADFVVEVLHLQLHQLVLVDDFDGNMVLG